MIQVITATVARGGACSMLFYYLFRSLEVLETPAGFTLIFLIIGPMVG